MKESKGDVDGVWCKSSRIDNNYKFFSLHIIHMT